MDTTLNTPKKCYLPYQMHFCQIKNEKRAVRVCQGECPLPTLGTTRFTPAISSQTHAKKSSLQVFGLTRSQRLTKHPRTAIWRKAAIQAFGLHGVPVGLLGGRTCFGERKNDGLRHLEGKTTSVGSLWFRHQNYKLKIKTNGF